jgi:hypothetical protein
VGLASDPATGSEGQLYFNTTDDVVKVYANGAWTELTGGGGGSVIYTPNQPDVTGLEVGTIWVDSDATISSGGGSGTGLSFWSEDNLGNLIPDSASVQNIGSLQYPVKDIFLSASSIYLGNTQVVSNGSTLIVGSNELLNSSTASTLYATKTELNNINLSSAIITASAAAAAYTDSELASIDLSATIQTASAAAVSYLVDGAPAALNTLNELSAALNDDPNILNSLLTASQASATYLPLSSSASFYRWTKTYSASASVISGVDDNSISLSYNAGYIQLFINGVMLDPSEYTATSGSAITVSTPVLSGEVVDIFAFLNSTSVNTYSQAQIDNKYNNLTRWKKAYSASATVISGVDDNSNTLSYLSGYEQFYLNGILLTPITDYARTSASVVTLSTALISGDIVEIINTQPFNVADVYNTSQSDNRYLTQSSASTTYLTLSSASADYIPDSIIDAKGDIITATADNTPARLAVGSASTSYLRPDPSSSTGLKWDNDAWTSFTPIIKQGATTLTANVAYSRYKQIGKTVFLQIDATITNTGSTNGAITIDVPSGVFPVNSTNEGVIGNMYIRDTGTAFYAGIVATNGVIFFGRAYGSVNSMGASNPAFTLVNNDTVSIQVTYEVS